MYFINRLITLYRNYRSIFTLLIGFVLILFACVNCSLYDHFLADPVLSEGGDPRTYAFLAEQLLSDGVYAERAWSTEFEQFRAWRPPFYPLFLALILLFSGDFGLVVIFQYGLFILSGIIILIINLRILRSFATGVVCCFIFYSYPKFYYFASEIYSETLFITFSLLFILVFLLSFDKKSLWLWSLAGFLLGVTTLIRTVWLPMLLILSLVILVAVVSFPFVMFYRKTLFPYLVFWFKRMFLLVFFAWLVISPLTLRNYTIFGEVVLINTANAMNLYLGTRGDLHTGDWPFGHWGISEDNWQSVHTEVINPLRRQQGELGSSEELQQLAFIQIKRNTLEYITHKAWTMTRYLVPNFSTSQSITIRIIEFIIYTLFLTGCIVIIKNHAKYAILLLFFFFLLSASSSLSFFSERFVIPVLPLYFQVVAYGIMWFFDSVRKNFNVAILHIKNSRIHL